MEEQHAQARHAVRGCAPCAVVRAAFRDDGAGAVGPKSISGDADLMVFVGGVD